MSSSVLCHLFVYGTLKPGEHAFANLCEPFAIAAQPAQTIGRLYHLPLGYPAMTTESGWVQGVLLTLSSSDALKAIDAFEEYDPDRPQSSEYQRSLQTVYDQNQRPLGRAWIYTMSPEQVSRCRGLWLPHGNWTETLIA
ncbi:MAG: hypothetical protein DCF32_06430 [Leptolyngbya sp.]|nr:MAG: hypothetical protein DCF32_06430 [Leptolyngbya sp.]